MKRGAGGKQKSFCKGRGGNSPVAMVTGEAGKGRERRNVGDHKNKRGLREIVKCFPPYLSLFKLVRNLFSFSLRD